MLERVLKEHKLISLDSSDYIPKLHGEWYHHPPGELPKDFEPLRLNKRKNVGENFSEDGSVIFPASYMPQWKRAHVVSHMTPGVTMHWTTVMEDVTVVKPPADSYDNLVLIRRRDGNEAKVVLGKLIFR